eukprot:TRINITY_DN3504_c0_g1_i1.p1 TRINITY_DN3504_c0_g1~~TRINITY_DN3504_c0_g1_i1.p1  ORF type:complete len:209 (+),score=55.50 TRINITY_DN3504_c0_g1_i1:45-671(+)
MGGERQPLENTVPRKRKNPYVNSHASNVSTAQQPRKKRKIIPKPEQILAKKPEPSRKKARMSDIIPDWSSDDDDENNVDIQKHEETLIKDNKSVSISRPPDVVKQSEIPSAKKTPVPLGRKLSIAEILQFSDEETEDEISDPIEDFRAIRTVKKNTMVGLVKHVLCIIILKTIRVKRAVVPIQRKFPKKKKVPNCVDRSSETAKAHRG